MNSTDAVVVTEGRFAGTRCTGDCGGASGLRGTRQRDVSLPGKQTRRWIEAYPPSTRQINFCPGMEICEIRARPGGISSEDNWTR